MRAALPLIIYFVASIIGAVLKNKAEVEKKKQVVKPAPQVLKSEEFEDILVEPLTAFIQEQETEFEEDQVEAEIETEIETEEWVMPTRPQALKKEPVLRLNLAQAMIMSEIVRPPRSKRPWPSR